VIDPSSYYRGRVARTYEATRQGQREWSLEAEAVETWLRAHAHRGDVLLDAPVGTGRFLALYETLGIRCLGLDISADMIAEARAKDSPDAELRVADLLEPTSLAPLVSDLAVCLRFANWLTEEELERLAIALSVLTRRRILLGIATSRDSPVDIAGARTHVERRVHDLFSDHLLFHEGRYPITAGRGYDYALWLLRVGS